MNSIRNFNLFSKWNVCCWYYYGRGIGHRATPLITFVINSTAVDLIELRFFLYSRKCNRSSRLRWPLYFFFSNSNQSESQTISDDGGPFWCLCDILAGYNTLGCVANSELKAKVENRITKAENESFFNASDENGNAAKKEPRYMTVCR